MTKPKDGICVCCKNHKVGKSGVMCTNCWSWVTNEMTIVDIAVVAAHIHHREPDNKHAREISQYLVADNYMQGKAHLPKKQLDINLRRARLTKKDVKYLTDLVSESWFGMGGGTINPKNKAFKELKKHYQNSLYHEKFVLRFIKIITMYEKILSGNIDGNKMNQDLKNLKLFSVSNGAET